MLYEEKTSLFGPLLHIVPAVALLHVGPLDIDMSSPPLITLVAKYLGRTRSLLSFYKYRSAKF
jgi:hypothetical protein